LNRKSTFNRSDVISAQQNSIHVPRGRRSRSSTPPFLNLPHRPPLIPRRSRQEAQRPARVSGL